MKKKQLSIIIPVYNEENSVKDTLTEIFGVMEKSRIDYEVIAVNDGSKDHSHESLLDFQAKNKKFSKRYKVVSHIKNKGYGASLKTGIRKAESDIIFITDADSTYPNKDIPRIFALYNKGYDMVVGKREFGKLPTLTKPAKFCLHILASYLVEQKIPDLNSGFRVFRKDLAMKYFPIICDGFSFTTTITLAMLTNGYAVHYEPIEYYKRVGSSKIKPIRDTANFISLIIRTVMYYNPLKIFLPLGFLVLATAVILFILGQFHFWAKSPSNSIIVLFVGGVQILVTGMLADLIDKRLER
jgi:glycosyltransferase involved in cell wall biosynthesis